MTKDSTGREAMTMPLGAALVSPLVVEHGAIIEQTESDATHRFVCQRRVLARTQDDDRGGTYTENQVQSRYRLSRITERLDLPPWAWPDHGPLTFSLGELSAPCTILPIDVQAGSPLTLADAFRDQRVLDRGIPIRMAIDDRGDPLILRSNPRRGGEVQYMDIVAGGAVWYAYTIRPADLVRTVTILWDGVDAPAEGA